MTDVTDINGTSVRLDAKPRTSEAIPSYSDAPFEVLLAAVEKDALRKALVLSFRVLMKDRAHWRKRAEVAEKQLTKAAREQAIYTMHKRGMSQREIADATNLHFPAVNKILKKVRAEREGHTGSAAQYFDRPTGNRRAYADELRAIVSGDDVEARAIDDTSTGSNLFDVNPLLVELAASLKAEKPDKDQA